MSNLTHFSGGKRASRTPREPRCTHVSRMGDPRPTLAYPVTTHPAITTRLHCRRAVPDEQKMSHGQTKSVGLANWHKTKDFGRFRSFSGRRTGRKVSRFAREHFRKLLKTKHLAGGIVWSSACSMILRRSGNTGKTELHGFYRKSPTKRKGFSGD